jgi:hypothetical protein
MYKGQSVPHKGQSVQHKGQSVQHKDSLYNTTESVQHKDSLYNTKDSLYNSLFGPPYLHIDFISSLQETSTVKLNEKVPIVILSFKTN